MSEEKKEEILDQEKELDANELDDVAGGESCICMIGGGGEPDNFGGGAKTCACVLGGAGEWTHPSEDGSKTRCVCAIAGSGDKHQN